MAPPAPRPRQRQTLRQARAAYRVQQRQPARLSETQLRQFQRQDVLEERARALHAKEARRRQRRERQRAHATSANAHPDGPSTRRGPVHRRPSVPASQKRLTFAHPVRRIRRHRTASQGSRTSEELPSPSRFLPLRGRKGDWEEHAPPSSATLAAMCHNVEVEWEREAGMDVGQASSFDSRPAQQGCPPVSHPPSMPAPAPSPGHISILDTDEELERAGGSLSPWSLSSFR